MSTRPKRWRIGGKTWRILDTEDEALPDGQFGECRFQECEIVIPTDGTAVSDLATILHECAHAVTPMVSEDFCEAIEDAAGLLVALGWHKGE